jgi:hypothetical protein
MLRLLAVKMNQHSFPEFVPLVPYSCESLPVTLRQELRFKAFENTVLRIGPDRKKNYTMETFIICIHLILSG